MGIFIVDNLVFMDLDVVWIVVGVNYIEPRRGGLVWKRVFPSVYKEIPIQHTSVTALSGSDIAFISSGFERYGEVEVEEIWL